MAREPSDRRENEAGVGHGNKWTRGELKRGHWPQGDSAEDAKVPSDVEPAARLTCQFLSLLAM